MKARRAQKRTSERLHRVFLRPRVKAGALLLLVISGVALGAPVIAPHDPIQQNIGQRLARPSLEYPLGTDQLGRCLLSRLVYGARLSLQIGVVVVTITTLIGLVAGLIAGYAGGLIDSLVMRLADVVLAFPSVILALAIAGTLGPGLFNLMIALCFVRWPGAARLVRASVLSLRQEPFVSAARALGLSPLRVLFRHILPNCVAPIIVMVTFAMGYVILTAASLSFLGLGAQPPTPEWGAMLNSGRAYMRTAPHLTIFPGLAIMATVLAFTLLGDGLRDTLDPKLKRTP